GAQVFALPLDPILQILPMVTITPIPQLEDTALGVINVHGAVTPVVDLRVLIGMGEAPLLLYTPIILIKTKGFNLGLVVDEVMDVISVPVDSLTGLHGVIPEELGEAPILQGLAHIPDRILPLINPDYMLLPDQAKLLARVMEQLPDLFQEYGNPAAQGNGEIEQEEEQGDKERVA
ncbi:MAG: hypothetical protein EHM70_20325, partial [Chloroflexota bacterium]